MIGLQGINREISFLYSMQSIATIDSYMVHTCKYYTAVRRKAYVNYKDPESDCQRQQRGPYGRKYHMAIDFNSLLIKEWIIIRRNVYDSSVAYDIIDTIRNFYFIPADSVYDTSKIYDYIFENIHVYQ